MTQKKVVRNKAGENKELILSNGWDITKTDTGSKYMLTNSGVTIHGDRLAFGTNNKLKSWLNVFNEGSYIASVWIDSPQLIKEVKDFIKVI